MPSFIWFPSSLAEPVNAAEIPNRISLSVTPRTVGARSIAPRTVSLADVLVLGAQFGRASEDYRLGQQPSSVESRALAGAAVLECGSRASEIPAGTLRWPRQRMISLLAAPRTLVPGSPPRAIIVSSSLDDFGGGIMGFELNDASSGGDAPGIVSQPPIQK
jgi:hypothetical protein